MKNSYWFGKKVLVTGGAGLIGSYLVDLLVEDNAEVTVADNLSRGRLENLALAMDRIRFRQVDLRHLDRCEEVSRGQEVILNLACPAFGVEYSMAHHGEMLTDTVLIGFNMLEAARRQKAKRFLVVSSSCVYADEVGIPTREEESTGGSPETVNRGYGWGKRMLELQGQYFAKEYGMEVAIARPFNAYGIREPIEAEKAHVMPSLIRKVLEGHDPVVVWGSGNQTRSFVHGKDIAEGLKRITEHYAVADPVNVGHDQETTIRELVLKICTLTGSHPRLIFDTSKPEGAARKSADITKLREVTHGFQPQIPLEEGLKEFIDHFRGNVLNQGESKR